MDYDIDGDGVADAFDTDNDGAIDYRRFDTNGDGLFDVFAYDSNGDGVDDIIGYDTNGDVVVDQVRMDGDADGYLEVAAFDSNQDGVFEVVHIDTDRDGHFDRSVSGEPSHAQQVTWNDTGRGYSVSELPGGYITPNIVGDNGLYEELAAQHQPGASALWEINNSHNTAVNEIWLETDSDGDGIANHRDMYPNDRGRN